MHSEQNFYNEIKSILDKAKNKVYRAVNFAMVEAYWLIGKRIVEQQGGAERAEYGSRLIKKLSERLTADYGKGFTVTNLKNMRLFYLTFPKSHTLCDQLSWSHYRSLIKVENPNAREFYLQETLKANYSVRQLQRQIS